MDFLNTPEKLNRRMIHNPMGRFGEAVEQAKAVVFRESLQNVDHLAPRLGPRVRSAFSKNRTQRLRATC
jgi:hypothetical protein